MHYTNNKKTKRTITFRCRIVSAIFVLTNHQCLLNRYAFCVSVHYCLVRKEEAHSTNHTHTYIQTNINSRLPAMHVLRNTKQNKKAIDYETQRRSFHKTHTQLKKWCATTKEEIFSRVFASSDFIWNVMQKIQKNKARRIQTKFYVTILVCQQTNNTKQSKANHNFLHLNDDNRLKFQKKSCLLIKKIN